MKNKCEVCSRTIETHLLKQHKSLCFSCLCEEASESGVVSTFNIKQNPVHGICAVCEVEVPGTELSPSPWGFICSDCRTLCESHTGVSWETYKLTAQNEWLVKANSRILGPFSQEEINGQIRENRISPIDEIMIPRGRWLFLRDEEKFRKVLNEVKNRIQSQSDCLGF